MGPEGRYSDRPKRTLNSKKYGVDLIRYTHAVNTALHCSTKVDGSTDGKVHCWSTETGAKIAILQSDHPGPIQNLQFNPKYMMMATACTNMVMGV
nr:hypothetical protein BaRGS_001987 [Batillaria attramentaria]